MIVESPEDKKNHMGRKRGINSSPEDRKQEYGKWKAMESGKEKRVERSTRREWKEVHEESGKKYTRRVERSTRREWKEVHEESGKKYTKNAIKQWRVGTKYMRRVERSTRRMQVIAEGRIQRGCENVFSPQHGLGI